MVVVRRAETDADRRAVLEVAHAATRPEAPFEHFAALRLSHPRRALASWWLLEEDGRAASSLVRYPLRFSDGGGEREGYGHGAVATRPHARRRGLARTLCERAIEDAEAEGRRVGLLFSAIPPAYYERLAFRALPAWGHVAERPADLAASGPRAPLVPLDPRRSVERLAALYERHHAGSLHLRRDAAAFARTIEIEPRDLFFAAPDPERGYVRAAPDRESLDVLELVLPDEDRAPALRALAHLAGALGLARLEGWFPPVPEVAAHFRDAGRATTLPMVRGAEDVAGARFWASDHF
jgi:predicted N-acetyltransferase YhbS